jgi:[ribosomal protein S5]-alanine N-acetyltransferase
VEIITDRLLLREFSDGDLAALSAYQADPRSVEYWSEDAPPDQSRQLFDMFRRWTAETPRRNYQLAIAQLSRARELIGNCGVRCEGQSDGVAEFGIELAPRWWGHGYAAEAARAIVGFGFRELALREVRAVTVTENARVAKLLAQLGFTALGRRPGPGWMDARGWSETEWQLTRATWAAAQPT